MRTNLHSEYIYAGRISEFFERVQKTALRTTSAVATMQHIMDLRDSSDDERSFIDMTGDSDGERRPEPRVSGGGIDLTGATVRGVAATPSSAAMAWVAPPAPAPRITESPVAPRPADDDDEDFLAFFSSRRGPAPAPARPPAPPPLRRQPTAPTQDLCSDDEAPPAPRPSVDAVDLTASPPPPRKRPREAPPPPPPPPPTLPQTITARASEAFASRWPDASGAFTTPQSIKDAPPANAFRRALRQTASVEFYGGSRPLRHCLCVIDARDGRDAAVQAHERLAQILDDSICVCALVCAVDRPEWADAVIRLERRHSRLVTRLIWVQRGANAQKAVATWARTYARRFDRTRGKNNDDPLDFLHGQCVDDVKRWKRARPTKHVDAWAPALNTLLPDAAAEAVSLAFPSYSRLVERLQSEGPDCVARVPKKTAKERCVGPAAAARLRSLLTSENPDFVGS